MQKTQSVSVEESRSAIVIPFRKEPFNRRKGREGRPIRTLRIYPVPAKQLMIDTSQVRSTYAPVRPFHKLPDDCRQCTEWAAMNNIVARKGRRRLFQLTAQRVHKALSVAFTALEARNSGTAVLSASEFFSADNFTAIIASCADFVIVRVLIQIAADWLKLDAVMVKKLEEIACEKIYA